MRGNRLVAVVAAVVVLGSAGCGLRSDAADVAGGGPVEVIASGAFLADSAERTTDAGTGRFDMVVAMTGLAPGRDVTMTIEGAYDTTTDQAAMTADMSDFGDVAGELAPEGSDDAAEAASFFAEPMEIVVDGTTFYLRMPALAEATGQEWVSFDAGAVAAGGSPVSPGGMDPRVILDLLHGSGDVETVGTEDVRDVSTTHLRTTVTVDDLVARVPADQRDQLQPMLDSLEAAGAGIEPFPLDVWVDGEGLVRRIQIAYELPAGAFGATAGGGAGTEVGMTFTAEYFGFGEPVEITVPDPADVADGFGGLGGD